MLPGIIDIHFHVRAPGHPERGTFATETRAPAAGGMPTILEMPISHPGCARRSIWKIARRWHSRKRMSNIGGFMVHRGCSAMRYSVWPGRRLWL
ncbi:MAG: hypothetical protein R2867_15425 [Caldilineaceae bacterium]